LREKERERDGNGLIKRLISSFISLSSPNEYERRTVNDMPQGADSLERHDVLQCQRPPKPTFYHDNYVIVNKE